MELSWDWMCWSGSTRDETVWDWLRRDWIVFNGLKKNGLFKMEKEEQGEEVEDLDLC